MKLFIVLAFLVGGYYYLLMASTDLVLDQTMQLQKQYVTLAEQADQIAVGASPHAR
jgi:hypothetical protein